MLTSGIFLVLAAPLFVFGCGITTHIEVSHRAQDLWLHQPTYRSYVLQHQDALQGGSPYPDVMYDSLCYRGSLHQVAEDTHWYPFVKIAIEYMRDRYPPPLTSDNVQGQKFLAFLLGLAAHQVADVVWHASLTGCPNGFIDATAWESFDGDREKAHSSVDPGGDSVVDYELPINYIGLVNKWYVPNVELQEIYRRYAYAYQTPLELNATAERVQVCSDLMFVGRFGDALFLGIEYPKFSHNNSFLLESFHDYYYGGLANMAHQTVLYWDQIIAMYENGTDLCRIPDTNPYHLNCSSTPLDFAAQQSISYVRSAPSTFLPFASQSFPSSVSAEFTEIPNGIISNQSYASFGHASLFGDFNGDGLTDLVVSAPDYYSLGCSQGGRVFLLLGRKDRSLVPERNISVIEQIADQSLISPQCSGDRFGTSLALIDWNDDGFDDLVVGSPSHGFGFPGAVFIFAGSSTGLETQPFVRIDGNDEHDTIGFHLQTGHLDNDTSLDLIISSPYAQPNGYDQPQQGAVWIFFSSARRPAKQMNINNATFVLHGESARSKFGHSVQLVPSSCSSGRSAPILVVSSPASRGKLFFYSIESSPRLLTTIEGKENNEHFAESFAIRPDKCLLAVGSPTRLTDWYGGVSVISLTNLFERKKLRWNLRDAPVLLSIHGVRIFERLGTNVRWAPNGDLLVAAPLGKGKILPLQLEKSEGHVYVVPASRIPSQVDPKDRPIDTLTSTTFVAHNRLNRFGTHLNVLQSNSVSYLVVSSPFTTLFDTVRLPGMAYFQVWTK